MYPFSEKAKWCLEQAGWHENYKTNIDKYLKASQEAGCDVPKPIIQFLEKYGNLKILTPDTYIKGITIQDIKKGLYRTINTDPYLASEGEFCDELQHYKELVRVGAFYPIATLDQYYFIIMNDEAKVFGALLYDSEEVDILWDTGEEWLDKWLSSDTKDIKQK